VRVKTAANTQQEKMPPIMEKMSNPLMSTYQKIADIPSLDEYYLFWEYRYSGLNGKDIQE